LLDRFLALFLSLLDHLLHAAGVAGRADGRAALDAGAADAFDASFLPSAAERKAN